MAEMAETSGEAEARGSIPELHIAVIPFDGDILAVWRVREGGPCRSERI